ncbi:hypothetical protein IFHNHDMJ_01218 [Synechococcus sp. CBW1107]|nr:hypothetical protein IFHNHDMJ_01218 [Synechococcus sp. CBW1107]
MGGINNTAALAILSTLGGMALGAFVVWLASRLLKRWVMRLVGRTSSRTDDLLASLVLSTITPLAYLGVAVWGWQSLVSELQALGPPVPGSTGSWRGPSSWLPSCWWCAW